MSSHAAWPFLPQKRNKVVARAEGAYLYLEDGSKILDAAGGAIVANIGHGVEEVAEAVKAALLNCSYVVPGWVTDQRAKLMEELTEHWLPAHLTRAHFTSGGSEGNESAVKIAIQYHVSRGDSKRNVILARDISYHGTTISTAAISGHPIRKRGLEAILQEYPRIQTPYPLRCPLGQHHVDATDYYIHNLEETISTIGAENIAALIAEPLNGSSGGAITPPDGYWPRAQEILRQHGILLIIDEVMTGFGRTGVKFGSDLYGIKPDLMVAGKGLAGGYAAICGVFGTDEIADSIVDAGLNVMFHTFAALPQSCAAAVSVLQILRRDALVQRAGEMGQQLKSALNDRLSQHPLVAEIRGEGMLIGIEVVEDRATLKPFNRDRRITDRLVGFGMENGIFFYPGGTGDVRDIICIGAPFIIGETEIDLMVDILESGLNQLL